MKKLFVFQKNEGAYRRELECAYDRVFKDRERIDFEMLTLDCLDEKAVDVVVSNGLSREWYLILMGLNIVTITIDNWEKYHDLADMVIDCLSNDDKRYFTGKDHSVCENENTEVPAIDEIVNLIKKLEWNSTFFGFNVAYLSCMHLTDNIIFKINKYVQEENIRLIEYLCNCHDRRSVLVAEKNGFHFTDIRLTFKNAIKEEEVPGSKGLSFGKASEQDISMLRKKIGGDFYKDSRYFFDGNFDVQKTNEFFQVWIEKAVRGTYDDECWCLFDGSEPVAYCTLRYDKLRCAHIGLLGVDSKYQGRGLGKQMLGALNNLLFAMDIRVLYVVTQGRNYAAQRLYQRSGFRTKATQLWYHKWI